MELKFWQIHFPFDEFKFPLSNDFRSATICLNCSEGKWQDR